MTLFDFAYTQKIIEEVDTKSLEEGFWNDQKEAKRLFDLKNDLVYKKKEFEYLNSEFESLFVLSNTLENKDEEMITLLESEYETLNKRLLEFKNLLLFKGPYDHLDAILEIHPGAGGTEACDWAEMLLRMYKRFAEKNDFKYEILDYLSGDEAGLKSVTLKISGKNIYGLLKSEKGVHRLVRISPFDASKKRHTSFASVNVVPFFDDSINITINPSDLKIDTYRSGGAGGQNVNKVETAIRITHLPSGIVVSCQIERTQIKNKEIAMNMLKSKLYELEERRKESEMNGIIGEQKNIEWGSQIRSYVFCPYTLVKDNRTSFESTQINDIMDGEIGDFLFAYLKKETK